MRDGRPDAARGLLGRMVEQERTVLALIRELQLLVAKPR